MECVETFGLSPDCRRGRYRGAVDGSLEAKQRGSRDFAIDLDNARARSGGFESETVIVQPHHDSACMRQRPFKQENVSIAYRCVQPGHHNAAVYMVCTDRKNFLGHVVHVQDHHLRVLLIRGQLILDRSLENELVSRRCGEIDGHVSIGQGDCL